MKHIFQYTTNEQARKREVEIQRVKIKYCTQNNERRQFIIPIIFAQDDEQLKKEI